ncbi:amidase [Paralcaligenes ureilyticus]|uniref:Aspartyl-tRNA(Asn)/glutamyl-tRNA(Gln) amidotransferase subunit A n=1 Tax=Paralcaligenes ureilyticus TaxID=627131 RepID=A0A4R3M7Z5_9BURK|nr:amidase [Paralcaligenes ureilyticus]TCT09614.1 aspartyl-tRNA(Asn)/glutamyl-tRNA(Gln) amidotransferase subunit A [Paralcaligenes ureilyticus]
MECTVFEAADLIRKRVVSPVELTRSVLERITDLNPTIRAFITVTPEHALAQATSAERELMLGRVRGPLHGVPFALKDIIDTAGIPTTGHSKVGMHRVPSADAILVRRLYDAGAILVGKLATFEYAHGGHSEHTPWPEPRNPWHLDYATGGSSSGSAAAVASRMVPFAIGTDTGGSIRIPAGATGIAGFKPTYGLINRTGVMTNSFTFDHCGPMARTAEDCALVLQALTGHNEPHPDSAHSSGLDLSQDLRGLRVGLVRHFWEDDLQLDCAAVAAVESAVEVLVKCGASVETARMAPLREYNDVKWVIGESEIFAVHVEQLQARMTEYGSAFLSKTLAGSLFDAVDYICAQRERRRLLDQMKHLYERYDVLLTAGGNPARLRGEYRVLNAWKVSSIYTPFSVTGAPAISVCAGFTTEGLPLSIQIAGRPFEDWRVLRVAHAYEKATGWYKRTPPADTLPTSLVVPSTTNEEVGETSSSVQQLVRHSLERAGLQMDEVLFRQLCAVAPFAFAMGERIRRSHHRGVDPALFPFD